MADIDPLELSLDEYTEMDDEERFLYNLYLEQNQWSTMDQIGQCVHGCYTSVEYTIGKLLLVTFLQRLVNLTYLPAVLKHISSVYFGLLILPAWIPREDVRTAIVAGVPVLVLFLLMTPLPYKGVTTILVCILSTVAVQYSLPPTDFVAIRGLLMVLSMKISSLVSDKASNFSLTDAIAVLAYLISPATLVFGPFHTFDDFVALGKRRTLAEEVKSFVKSAALVGVAFCFMAYSSCLGIVFPKESILADYAIAQSFRSSHYFVSMLSEGLALLSGMQVSTCSPIAIEIPRSLVEIVVAWNKPMHRFLHSYVYQKLLPLGGAIAVLASFTVSSLLHGFNFQISAVLLSLGVACYFENKLRNRISSRFSMCVRARPCGNCNHERKWNSWMSLSVNAIFCMIAVYQLIYLGAPFDGEGAEIGYEMNHTIAVWRRHYFAGHALTTLTALLCFCF